MVTDKGVATLMRENQRNRSIDFSLLLSQSRKHLQQIYRMVGREAFLWMLSGIFGVILLSGLDYGLALLLQLIFKSVGFGAAEPIVVPLLSAVTETKTGVTLSFLVIGVSRGLVQFFVNYSAIAVSEGLSFRFRRCALEEMLVQSPNTFISASEMNYRISEVFPKASQFCYNVANVIPIALNCLLLLILMISTSVAPTVTAIVGLFFTGLFVLRVNRAVRQAANKLPAEQSALVSGIERIAKNWLLVRIFRMNNFEYNRLVKNAARYWQHSSRGLFLANLAGAIPTIAGTFLLVIVLTANDLYWHNSGVEIVTVLYLLIRFVQALGNGALHLGLANSNWNQFKACYKHFENLPLMALDRDTSSKTFVHDSWSHTSDSHDKKETAKSLESDNSAGLPPEIVIQDLDFSYPGDCRGLYRKLSLKIDSGSIFGIKGRSGSGKSTLVNLILGILSPNSGSIRISGHSPATYFAKPAESIGYVGPEPFMIEGTMRENLLYGNLSQPSLVEIRKALESAQILEFVDSSPAGLDTRIKENGEGLSAGQKQRLSLARALLRKPRILILDEASSNLDETTEREVADSVGRLKGQCTVIIVSHRQGFFRHADTVFDTDAEK